MTTRGGSNLHDHPLDAADWLRGIAAEVEADRPTVAHEMRMLADKIEADWNGRGLVDKALNLDVTRQEHALDAWVAAANLLQANGMDRRREVAVANAEGAAGILDRELVGDGGGLEGILRAGKDTISDIADPTLGFDPFDPDEARENRDDGDKRRMPPIVWVGLAVAGAAGLWALAPAIKTAANALAQIPALLRRTDDGEKT